MTQNEQAYLTVRALTEYIKHKFDRDPHLQRVHVVGEISNYRERRGSQYFSLKDDQALINVVMFANDFNRVKFKLEDGMRIRAIGHVSVYNQQGRYQLYIRDIEPDGIGSLYLAFEQLKEKFRKAGLFDLPKKPIPKYANRIAVITSPSGSVIHDISSTIQRRNPLVEYVLFPSKVQGEDAPREIIQQLEAIQKRHEEFDLIIIARGGGSIEDLWAFNNEALAKAALNSKIPIISSIGHETDTTLLDMVADLRAETPTGAAEHATTPLIDIQTQLHNYAMDLNYTMNHRLRRLEDQLQHVRQLPIFVQVDRFLSPYVQQIDIIDDKFSYLFDNYFQDIHYQLERLMNLTSSDRFIEQIIGHVRTLKLLEQSLTDSLQRDLQLKQQQIRHFANLLEAYNPNAYLKRGYSIVTADDVVIHRVADVSVGQHLSVQMMDGKLDVQVNQIVSDNQ